MERQDETPQVPLIVARIRAETTDLDEFEAQYCRYFGVDIVFLPTEGLQPPGRQVRFIFALADGREVITGDGVVLRMRRDTGNPHRPPGMELRYQILDEESQRLVDRMVELRTSGGARRPDPPPYVSMSFENEVPTRNGHLGNPAGVKVADPAPVVRLASRASVMPRPSVVPRHALPANPFADVSAEALAYFVDWAIEHATDPRRRWSAGAYCGIPLGAPRAPRRTGPLVAFSGGVITAGAVFLLGGALAMSTWRAPQLPLAAAASSASLGLESGASAAAPALGIGGGPLTMPPASPLPVPAHEAVAPPARDTVAPPAHDVVAPPAPAVPPPNGDGEALWIVSHPGGARVRVDGTLRGRTPLLVSVAPGAHEVILERPRYAPLRIDARAPGKIVGELERPSASLNIESTPSGAQVTVDGHPLGSTPLSITTTAYERHRVQLELDGASVRRRPYVKPPGETVRIELSR